jgi:hypothetical protein|uniref:Uncharacterized protein n=1 Tax=Siphoviridae sp. ctCCX1 TaxID=2823567 RepID=A0A8S5LDS2_9CAUD|nr:MAG TPA: hypothetical protein [Siphoviridae sp. ctCCX1]DAZ05623.1 MAG TPA: hypothetical protein [Caudoviricetes sp.]
MILACLSSLIGLKNNQSLHICHKIGTVFVFLKGEERLFMKK